MKPVPHQEMNNAIDMMDVEPDGREVKNGAFFPLAIPTN